MTTNRFPIRAAGYAVIDTGNPDLDLADYYGPITTAVTREAAIRAYRETPDATDKIIDAPADWDGTQPDDAAAVVVRCTEEFAEWHGDDGVEFPWTLVDGIACTPREDALARGDTASYFFYGPGTVGPDGNEGEPGADGANRFAPEEPAPAEGGEAMLCVSAADLARLASVAGIEPAAGAAPSEILREALAYLAARANRDADGEVLISAAREAALRILTQSIVTE